MAPPASTTVTVPSGSGSRIVISADPAAKSAPPKRPAPRSTDISLAPPVKTSRQVTRGIRRYPERSRPGEAGAVEEEAAPCPRRPGRVRRSSRGWRREQLTAQVRGADRDGRRAADHVQFHPVAAVARHRHRMRAAMAVGRGSRGGGRTGSDGQQARTHGDPGETHAPQFPRKTAPTPKTATPVNGQADS